MLALVLCLWQVLLASLLYNTAGNGHSAGINATTTHHCCLLLLLLNAKQVRSTNITNCSALLMLSHHDLYGLRVGIHSHFAK